MLTFCRVAPLLLLALAFAPSGVRAASNCNTTIYGVNESGGLYSFLPPSALATAVAGAPTLPFGTIARGVYSGNIYIVAGTASNSGLYSYNLTSNTLTQVGTFPNTTFLYASGFGINGVGYAISSAETYSYTDAATPVISKLGPPQTTSGPAVSAFNSGDLAVDVSNNGWTVLSNTSSGISYLYKITFGNPTILAPIAQITLGGVAYAAADLYSLAFGANGILYTSGGNSGTLYSINQSTGALTSLGAQGVELVDFGSCPFSPQLVVAKTGPTVTASGEFISYAVTVTNSPTATTGALSLTLTDPIPTGITVERATCTGTNGGTCTTPTITGQTVTTTIATLPINATVTLSIAGKDVSLPLGTTTNTATLTTLSGQTQQAPATTSVVANTMTKTVADITSGTSATGTDTGKPGDVLEYTLSYTNSTNASLATFALTDSIPANTTYVAGTAACVTVPSGLTCTPSGPASGTLTWTISGGALAPGATVTVKFHVTIN